MTETWWSVLMLVSAGLFAAGVVPIVWERARTAPEIERLRTGWLGGHRIRTGAALVAFALLVVAAVVCARFVPVAVR